MHRVVPVEAGLLNTWTIESGASGYSLNSIYRIIFVQTFDTRNSVAFPSWNLPTTAATSQSEKSTVRLNNAWAYFPAIS